jgi:hypothetical protein
MHRMSHSDVQVASGQVTAVCRSGPCGHRAAAASSDLPRPGPGIVSSIAPLPGVSRATQYRPPADGDNPPAGGG